jgi:hypothetical protein
MKKILIIIGLVVLILISLHMILRYSDIQSNRYVFMYQSKFLSPQEYLNIYNKYTGTWRTWYDNGAVMGEQTLSAGKIAGPYRYYFRNGQLYQEGEMRNGKHVTLREWTESGKEVVNGIFKNGIPFQGTFIFSRFKLPAGATSGSSTIDSSNTYLEEYMNGKLVKRTLLSESGIERSTWNK